MCHWYFFFISIDTKKKKKHWKILEKVSTEALPTFFLCGHKFVVIATTNAFDDASTFLPTKVKKTWAQMNFYTHNVCRQKALSSNVTTFVGRNCIFTHTWCINIDTYLPTQQPLWIEINFCPQMKCHHSSITTDVYYTWSSCISSNTKRRR